MSERIRLTITVTPEVRDVFQRMADTAGVSLGRAMGDWLCDTVEGAQFVSLKMAEAKQAPKTVMREFQAMAQGLKEQVDSTLEEMRRAERDRRGRGAAAPGAGRAAPLPPSSPTGGKSPARKGK